MNVSSPIVQPVVRRTLRILVADDHELVRGGLRTLLETQSGWKVCGEAATGQEAVEKARQHQPDVVVLDIHMPGLNGLEAAREILATEPRTEILILTLDESTETIRRAAEAGARAIVMKSDAARDLLAAVAALARHEPFYTPKVSEIVMRTFTQPLGAAANTPDLANPELTSREQEVVVLVAEGRSNKEIAAALNISVKTVESHRRNLMHKLRLNSSAELVRFAVRNGLVQA
ncbi:MAG TPA: response regulator transcription factor [Verrucomicrobiae bacterium]|nr:response regulator transcription factor [Verrucomicrobiae bacterium]